MPSVALVAVYAIFAPQCVGTFARLHAFYDVVSLPRLQRITCVFANVVQADVSYLTIVGQVP